MRELDSLRLFVRLCETKSFSQAARELGTKQPAASKRLRALEAELGVTLLERNTRGLRPSAAGALFYPQCKRWLEEIESVQERLLSAKKGVHGPLKLSVPVSIGQVHVTRIVLEFQRLHPGIVVHLSLNDRIVDLVEEGVDVAIRIGPPGQLQVVARRLGHYHPLLVAAPAYLEEHPAPTGLADLAQHRLLYYGDRDELVWMGGKSQVARRDPALTLDDPLAVREAVREGFGLGLINPWLVERDLARGTLVRVGEGAHGERFDVHAVTLAGRNAPARIRTFVAFVAQELPKIPGMVAPE